MRSCLQRDAGIHLKDVSPLNFGANFEQILSCRSGIKFYMRGRHTKSADEKDTFLAQNSNQACNISIESSQSKLSILVVL